MKYCKFISQVKSSQVKSSQVKSSQVKSSAKIISLIALFILLFSISCKSKQNPEDNPKYLELEGTWGREYGWYTYGDLSIDNNGNITLFCSEYANEFYKHTYTYIGKIENNFEYPYTVKITQTSFYQNEKLLTDSYYNEHTGTITFDNASSCSVDFYTFFSASGRWGIRNLNFTKQ